MRRYVVTGSVDLVVRRQFRSSLFPYNGEKHEATGKCLLLLEYTLVSNTCLRYVSVVGA